MPDVHLPLVSIVIPVYNREVLMKMAVESAVNQTYKNVEIIIIDNNSTDKTFEIACQYQANNANVKAFKNQENIGPVNNWIAGINYANGQYIKLLFSDDWISEDYLEKTVGHFNDLVGLVFTPAIIHKNVDIVNYRLYKSTQNINSATFLKYMLLAYRTPVSPGCALFRKVDLLEILKIVIDQQNHSEYLRYGAGIDLLTYLIVAENYDNVVYVHNTYAHFLQHDDSFTYANVLDKYYIKAFKHFLQTTQKINFKGFYRLLHHTRGYKFIRYFSNKFDY